MTTDKIRTPVRPPRNVKLHYFAIALVPICISVIYGLISDHFIPDSLVISSDIVQKGRPWLEAAGRYRFLAATWLFGAFTIFAFVLLVINLVQPTTRQTRVAAIGVLLFILLFAVSSTLRNIGAPDSPGVYRHIGADVFEAVLSQGTLPGCAGTSDEWLLGRCGEMPVVTMFHRVMDIINVLAGLGVGTLIVGMILCLESRDKDDVEGQAAMLAENLRQMRQQLYISSLVLTFGMLFATSWMYWPLGMIVEAERDAYGSVLLATALFTGTYFSLLIMSFFLPVSLILEGRIRKLANMDDKSVSRDTPFDIDKQIAAHGLKDSAGDYLRAGLAITAPILTAFAGGISPIGL